MSKSSSYNKPPIHPNVWRASQLAQAQGRYIDTGYKALSQQLPGKGWPLGQLINVLVQQPGVGELQLVLPALSHLNQGPIVLLNPGYQPQIAAWVQHGLAPSHLLWVAAPNSSNALWAALQILRSAAFPALLFWQTEISPIAQRKLQLAAQKSQTLFFMFQPIQAAQQASPAPLRLGVQAGPQGPNIRLLKRRGSPYTKTISLPRAEFLRFGHSAANPSYFHHASLDQSLPSQPCAQPALS